MARYFTLEEALELLPKVRELVTEMVTNRDELRRAERELSDVSRRARGNGHASEGRVQALEEAAKRMAEAIRTAVSGIEALGVEVKDLDRGLVDFLSRRDGRDVYLCWMLGEETIAWWHPVETGFSGREPL